MMPMMAFATSGTGSSISVEDGSAKVGGDELEFILDFDDVLTTGANAEDIADAAGEAVTDAQDAFRAAKTAATAKYFDCSGDGNTSVEDFAATITVKAEPETADEIAEAADLKAKLIAAHKKVQETRAAKEEAYDNARALANQ